MADPNQKNRPSFASQLAERNGSVQKNDFAEDEPTDPGIVVPIGNASARGPAASPPTPRMPDFGLLAPLMKDPSITEIMVNDLRNVMIEKEGQLSFSGLAYTGIDELNRLVRNITDITGRILSPDSPYLDCQLPDGSRVNIVGPPLTANGPCVTIRKFPTRRMTLTHLVAAGMLDQRIGYFLNACVAGKINLLIAGGTGSGKTTLLNALSFLIPSNERIVTIEDTPELVLQHINSVKLQTKPQSPGSAPVTARELVANAMRMRPDRVIVGECRKAEAFDMLQAMNTGHEGSMTTIHANSTRDALSRLETLCLLAGADLPHSAIRKQLTSALDLVIQLKRFRDGKRRVVAIAEITGMEGETITMQDLFLFDLATGTYRPTGLVPAFIGRIQEHGIDLPTQLFN